MKNALLSYADIDPYKLGEEECRVRFRKRMASNSNKPGHRASKSFHAIRTPIGVLPMAMDSNRVHDYPSKVRVCKRVNSASVLGQKDSGFESREPTSPKVSCIGQIKMKPHWVKETKPAKAATTKNANKSHDRFSRVKKFMFGKRHEKENHGHETGAEETAYKLDNEVHRSEGFPSLGNIKRFSSLRYDHKFGDLFEQEIGKNDEERVVSAINAW